MTLNLLLVPAGLLVVAVLLLRAHRRRHIGWTNWVLAVSGYVFLTAMSFYFLQYPIYFKGYNNCGGSSEALALTVPHDDPSVWAQNFVNTCHALARRHMLYGWLSLATGLILLLSMAIRVNQPKDPSSPRPTTG